MLFCALSTTRLTSRHRFDTIQFLCFLNSFLSRDQTLHRLCRIPTPTRHDRQCPYAAGTRNRVLDSDNKDRKKKKKKSAEHGTSTKIVDEFPKLYSNLSLSRSGRLGIDWLVTSWPFAGPDFHAQYVLVRFCYPQAYAQRRRGAGGSQIFHCTWRSMRCVRHSQPSSASPMPHNPNVDPCT